MTAVLALAVAILALVAGFGSPGLSACLLAAGIAFPVSLVTAAGVSVKALDIAILGILGAAGLKALTRVRLCVSRRSLQSFSLSSISVGATLLMIGGLTGWLGSRQGIEQARFIFELAEAYVAVPLIALFVLRGERAQEAFAVAMVIAGAAAGVHAAVALVTGWGGLAGYYEPTAGRYGGLLRLRGFHSFSLGFIEAVALVLGAFLWIKWSRRGSGAARLVFLGAMLAIVSATIVGTLTRIWAIAAVAGLLWVVRGRLGIKSRLGIKRGLQFAVVSMIAMLALSGLLSRYSLLDYGGAAVDRFDELGAHAGIRLDRWEGAWDKFAEDALLGVGVGNAKVPDESHMADVGDIDNGFLQVLFEVGVAGLAGVLLMFVGAWVATTEAARRYRSDVTIDRALQGGLVVTFVGLTSWNLMLQGSAPAVLIGLLVGLAAGRSLDGPPDYRGAGGSE